jgi:hypothetical protein
MDFQKPVNAQPTNYEMPQVMKDASQTVDNTISDVKNTLTNTFNEFSKQATDSNSQFNFSNTIIAKFAFLILVIIVFMFLINLGIFLIAYFTAPNNNPYVIKGMIDGTYGIIVPQNPKDNDSVTILRSNNESKGMEFTWSVWLYINDIGLESNKHQHIFNKGTGTYNQNTGLSTVNNAPGLYLGPGSNTLKIIMNSVSDPNDSTGILSIDNIPIRKWVNVVIRLENVMLDIYVNGTISSRSILENVPKQNYDDIYVCQNGGFSGKLSDLRYYNYALNVFEINRIVNAGPNTSTNKRSQDQIALSGGYSYLSTRWFNSKL